MSKQFDNSNSGALFATSDKGIMTGPFQFDEKEPKHVVVLEVGEPGSAHTMRVHERKKDLSPGKLVAEGKIQRSNGAATNAAGNARPVARGVISSKKHGELRVCLWAQSNANGSFYQVKPDSFEPREAPAL